MAKDRLRSKNKRKKFNNFSTVLLINFIYLFYINLTIIILK